MKKHGRFRDGHSISIESVQIVSNVVKCTIYKKCSSIELFHVSKACAYIPCSLYKEQGMHKLLTHALLVNCAFHKIGCFHGFLIEIM